MALSYDITLYERIIRLCAAYSSLAELLHHFEADSPSLHVLDQLNTDFNQLCSDLEDSTNG